jgi:hypothetical protein
MAETQSEDQKASFAKPSSEEDKSGDDVLSLNIGGTVVNVLRRTICRGERSLLASQFSGEQDDKLIKDPKGNFFINQSYKLFSILLNHLWARDNWTPRAPPVEAPGADDFPSKREYFEFLGMVEYYDLAPVVYPTRIIVYKGNADGSKIEQYPFCFVGAPKLTTFVMQTEGHSRSITSFQIKVGKIDDFRVGWAGDEFVILDCLNSKLHMRGGAIIDAKSPIQLQDGSKIRCERSARSFRWEVDGTIIFDQTFEKPASTLIPAFKGKGTWQITEVLLAYC